MINRSRPKALHPMPFVRIELAVLAVSDGVQSERALQVLLGRRAEAPYAGRWALPGGVLRIDQDCDLDAACQRVARERLGVELPGALQLTAVGGAKRDPRAPWALSVVYRCTTLPARLEVSAGKRMAELKWVDAGVAIQDRRLAFDHSQLVARAVESLRAQVRVLQFPAGLIEEPFTLGELQGLAAVVLGETVDKSSFRRRLDASDCVDAVEGKMRTGPFRPAQLFVFGGDK